MLKALKELFSSPPQKTVNICPIRYSSLMAIFQFSNPQIFRIEDTIPITDENIRNQALILKGLKSPSAGHLLDTERTRITSRSDHMRRDATNLTFIEYTHTAIEVGDEQWAVILLSTASAQGNEVKFITQFTMAGRYKLHPTDGSTVFYPEHTFCLFDMNGADVYYSPQNHGGLQASLLYANQAFIQFISGHPIDYKSNQSWITDQTKYPHMAKTLSNLIGRTAHSLSLELKG